MSVETDVEVPTLDASRSLISGISSKLSEVEKSGVGAVSAWVDKIKNLANLLHEEIVLDLPQPNIESHRRSRVFACDGTIYTQKYSSIYLTLASACSYDPNEKSIKPIFLPDILFCHPYRGDLVCSLRMKTLEYRVAFETLKSLIEQGKKPDLVLLDGTLTFPDDFRTSDSPDWVKEEFEKKFLKHAQQFYQLLKEERIVVAGISKDPTANKYLLGIRKILTGEWRSRYRTMTELDSPIEVISSPAMFSLFGDRGSWRRNFSTTNELGLMRRMFWNEGFKRTKITEVSCATRFPVAITIIRGRVSGFYFKIFHDVRPFYVEAVFWEKNKEKVDSFFQTLCNLSYYSSVPGYPAPLFFAHHVGKLSTKYADGVLNLVHGLLTKTLHGDYRLLLEDRFRESM